MTTFLIVLPDHTVWMVEATSQTGALAQYRREMPRALGRHRGVFLQVVAPHRMNEPEPVKIADVTGVESCACCFHGISHRAALQQDALGRTCKTCGHTAYVHRDNNGGTDDRSNPEPG